MKKITKIFTLALSLFYLTSFALPVYADDSSVSPELSPVSQRLVLRKKETTENTFKLSNKGKNETEFTVYAAPLTVAGEDYQMNFSHENLRTQVSRWITFKQDDGNYSEKTTYKLKPGEDREITYRVTVPEDIPDGGQYALIFAEATSKSSAPSQNGVRVIPRLSLVIFGRTDGGTRQEAEITDVKLSSLLIGSDIESSALIKNTGNTDLNTSQELKVSTIFGKILYAKTENYPIYPDQPRRISMKANQKPSFGISLYKVELNIKAHDKNYHRTAIVVSMSPIFAIISIILLTILVAWLIIFIKQRKERKAREMI